MKTTEQPRFDELWVEHPTGGALCALLRDDRGWLMHLPAPGSPGASSRDPFYRGPAGEMLTFRLSNGQLDTYPASWTLPREVIERALESFRDTGVRPTFITWHEDG